MKLRIKGDSLRLRLTRPEVEQLGTAGAVEDRIHFAGGKVLMYRLKRDAEAVQLVASFADGVIEVRVPEAAARQWCGTDQVALDGTQSNGGTSLRILVEKDFACLKPREDEDESDNFPNPQTTCG